jgi:hypothetical protein
MKFLFVTYCFGGDPGQAVVHVYRRGLRIALELQSRGHEIVFFCTGRESYRDELTELAEQRLRFIDLPYRDVDRSEAERQRRLYHCAVAELAPDAIVVSEAPLGGALLQVTLTGVEVGVPVVIVDNAHSREQVHVFCRMHGPVADGLILNGPRANHIASPPSHLCQTPPLSSGGETSVAVARAADFLERLPRQPRCNTDAECAALGFHRAQVQQALQARHPQEALSIEWLRATHLRNCPDHALYAVVCAFQRNGGSETVRLWGRLFASPTALKEHLAAADSTRSILYASAPERMLLEADPGAAALPPLVI